MPKKDMVFKSTCGDSSFLFQKCYFTQKRTVYIRSLNTSTSFNIILTYWNVKDSSSA